MKSAKLQADRRIYVRARRQRTVVFLSLRANDTVGTVKKLLSEALQSEKSAAQIQLFLAKADSRVPLPDDDQTADAVGIQEESTLYFVFDDGQGGWEDVHIDEYEPLDDPEEEVEMKDAPSSKKEKGKGRA
ncbi:hypothetical protein BCR43DRAFT_523486 [Syncephalastrum racemosum]|uniref:Ubiquitin-like domain-containing protein n=1 Tax=Syncephalastrum racemosum TaxID=13706 RepID=A0A1X2HE91_SYNRA|nr:hypothetical protein BCR43DRAFT_523486 [Syncephalastrum racemosum]